jgi:DNA-binding response OmpR family regulator
MNEKPKILIVEDDTDLVESMKKFLESKDYDSLVAYDPSEGFEILKQELPDLIILDVMFGTKGEAKGFDFARKLRMEKQFAGIPILMLTAINVKKPSFHFSPDTDAEFLPVDSFLDKPFKPDEFFTKIDELLKQKSSKWRNWPQKEQ